MKVTIEIDGDMLKILNQIETEDNHEYSEFARFYDSSCSGWDSDGYVNRLILFRLQDHCNDILRRRGYLFLNEVYEWIGFPRSKIGQIVGWIGGDDKYVDFGLLSDRVSSREFMNERSNVVMLDFNVDGIILDKIF